MSETAKRVGSCRGFGTTLDNRRRNFFDADRLLKLFLSAG